MKERAIPDEKEVQITSTQIITSRATHSLSDVTSVETSYRPPRKLIAYFLLWVGGLLSLFLLTLGTHARGGDTYFFVAALFLSLSGLVLFFLGIRSLKRAKPVHTAVLATSLGAKESISSEDPELIQRVVEAVEEAMDARGIAP